MPGPALVAVEQDPAALRSVERELIDRYARHYRVMAIASPDEALAHLRELAGASEPVALVLAGQWLSGMTGSELLDEARHLHPHSRRGLLIPWGAWGDEATGEAIFDSIAHGRIDHYLLRPAESPDELFHQAISSLLLDWAETQRSSPHTIHVIGDSWSGRSYELRELLGRCAIAHSFCLADSPDGRALVAEAGAGEKFPMVIFPDGTVLANPSNAELASAAGSAVETGRTDFDIAIVGAGPAGLSTAVYGASEGFSTLVIDEGGLGGQATSSSLIRNYLGFPRGLSGRRLARQAYEQAWVFGASFAFMQRVTGLGCEDDGRLSLSLAEGGSIRARAVVLATGASYRRLGVPSLEALNGAGVFYGCSASEAPLTAGEDIYVIGGANSAGQAALNLARYAQRVTLVVRSPSLDAGMSHYLVRQVEATPRLHVRLGTEIVGGGGDGWLDYLVLRDCAHGGEQTVEADGLFLEIGARPHTEWLPPAVARDAGGFVLTGTDLRENDAWPLDRSPFDLETGVPGLLAAGDVRSGSVKRVASAVGEGSVAIQTVHRLLAEAGLKQSGRATEAASQV